MEKTTEEILERMAELLDLADPEYEDSEVYYEEYRKLQREVKNRLEPIIGLIVRAGLFTIYHEISEMSYDVSDVFDNGNFWLCVDRFPSMTPSGAGDDEKFGRN
jgi:hypothetical protein